MTCPTCGKLNVSAGHVLGHGGAGKPKDVPAAERQRRREFMERLNSTRAERLADKLASATAKATPGFVGMFVGSVAALVLHWLVKGCGWI